MSARSRITKRAPGPVNHPSRVKTSSHKSQTLKPFYPNMMCSRSCKPCFNWFSYGKRLLDVKTNLFYIAVPPTTTFLNIRTHTSVNVKNTSSHPSPAAGGVAKGESGKKMQIKEYPKILILSDLHNKDVLCKMYGECVVGCTSKKEKVSTECSLYAEKNRRVKLFNLALKLGFDGTVLHHDVCNRDVVCRRSPVSMECTFVIVSSFLENSKGTRCKIIEFSKLNNTKIRRADKTFPDIPKINKMMESDGCRHTEKYLYKKLLKYQQKK